LGSVTQPVQTSTIYVPPLAGSPLIDAGANCPLFDQIGASRVGPCDIGAVEFGGLFPKARVPIVLRQ